MDTADFFTQVRTYGELSAAGERAWAALLRPRHYARDGPFIRAGDVPAHYAFVVEGLFCQHYIGPEGDLIAKHFFPENRIAASVSATLTGTPSAFSITAIENSHVLEYDFAVFKGFVGRRGPTRAPPGGR